jgi:hypothetical protein
VWIEALLLHYVQISICEISQKDVQLLQMCGAEFLFPVIMVKFVKPVTGREILPSGLSLPPPRLPPPPPAILAPGAPPPHPQHWHILGWYFITFYGGLRIHVGIGLSYRPARKHWQAGQYDNSVPTRFLAPIECYRIPALDIWRASTITRFLLGSYHP